MKLKDILLWKDASNISGEHFREEVTVGGASHLEGSCWQVGDGHILQIVLEGVNERRHC